MAEQKLYICASAHFPHGDAGANRIQYLAKAFQEASYEVFVLSTGQNPKDQTEENGYYCYEGLYYRNLGINSVAKEKLLSGIQMVALMKKCGISSKDTVFIYGSNYLFVAPILNFCKRKKIKTIIDVVEWHQPFQYPRGEKDIRYRSVLKTFSKLAPKTDGIISISECIAGYYRNKQCYTEVFPVVIDIESIVCDVPNKMPQDTVHFIYPGNPIHKDDIQVMLQGLDGLSPEEKQRTKMHLTGVSEQKLRAFLGEHQSVIDRLGNLVIFHGWMEYEDLLSLYRSVDYLYMSRPDNLVTQANFPSKLPELMAYGIIPVGNRVGDYHTYLTDGVDSVLFLENTPAACTEALRRALSFDEETRKQMYVNARKTACEQFDYHHWTQKVKQFMEKL